MARRFCSTEGGCELGSIPGLLLCPYCPRYDINRKGATNGEYPRDKPGSSHRWASRLLVPRNARPRYKHVIDRPYQGITMTTWNPAQTPVPSDHRIRNNGPILGEPA